MPKYAWTPDTLIHYPLISAVTISPDGAQIAYTVRVAHLTDDASEFRHQLWVADREGNAPPRLLAHGASAEQPRWRPDGAHIAFLRKTAGGKVGLWLMPVTGGEPWPLTADDPVHGDIATYRWSPDGRRIAFLAAPVDAEKQKRIARRDDTLHYRVDFDFAHMYVMQTSGPSEPRSAPVQRTSGRHHVTSLAWSPESETVAFTFQDNTLDDSWTSLRLAVIPAIGEF